MFRSCIAYSEQCGSPPESTSKRNITIVTAISSSHQADFLRTNKFQMSAGLYCLQRIRGPPRVFSDKFSFLWNKSATTWSWSLTYIYWSHSKCREGFHSSPPVSFHGLVLRLGTQLLLPFLLHLTRSWLRTNVEMYACGVSSDFSG